MPTIQEIIALLQDQYGGDAPWRPMEESGLGGPVNGFPAETAVTDPGPYGTGIPKPGPAPRGRQYGADEELTLDDLNNPDLSPSDRYYLAGLSAYYNPADPAALENFQNWQRAMDAGPLEEGDLGGPVDRFPERGPFEEGDLGGPVNRFEERPVLEESGLGGPVNRFEEQPPMEESGLGGPVVNPVLGAPPVNPYAGLLGGGGGAEGWENDPATRGASPQAWADAWTAKYGTTVTKQDILNWYAATPPEERDRMLADAAQQLPEFMSEPTGTPQWEDDPATRGYAPDAWATAYNAKYGTNYTPEYAREWFQSTPTEARTKRLDEVATDLTPQPGGVAATPPPAEPQWAPPPPGEGVGATPPPAEPQWAPPPIDTWDPFQGTGTYRRDDGIASLGNTPLGNPNAPGPRTTPSYAPPPRAPGRATPPPAEPQWAPPVGGGVGATPPSAEPQWAPPPGGSLAPEGIGATPPQLGPQWAPNPIDTWDPFQGTGSAERSLRREALRSGLQGLV